MKTVAVPVADGGDGTLDAAISAGYRLVPVRVSGPTGAAVDTGCAVRDGVAVVELADACGLNRLPAGRLEPLTASSTGFGEVIAAALVTGCHRVILGVGGSASTDGGAGMLTAFGARILDGDNHEVPAGGGALEHVDRFDLTRLEPAVGGRNLLNTTELTDAGGQLRLRAAGHRTRPGALHDRRRGGAMPGRPARTPRPARRRGSSVQNASRSIPGFRNSRTCNRVLQGHPQQNRRPTHPELTHRTTGWGRTGEHQTVPQMTDGTEGFIPERYSQSPSHAAIPGRRPSHRRRIVGTTGVPLFMKGEGMRGGAVHHTWERQRTAAGRGMDNSVFFHPPNVRDAARENRAARPKAVCRPCPVIAGCLERALRVREPYGVRGGQTEDGRARLLGVQSLHYPALIHNFAREEGSTRRPCPKTGTDRRTDRNWA